MKKKSIKAEEFDKEFDNGEDVNVDFPVWMFPSLDKEAKRLGGDEAIHY